MTLREALTAIQAVPVVAAMNEDIEIPSCHAGDLMSDVLAWAAPGALLLTALANDQVARASAIRECAAVVLVQGKQPPDELVEAAHEESVPLYLTDLPLFEACGRIARQADTASA
jgi:hypothetical protein